MDPAMRRVLPIYLICGIALAACMLLAWTLVRSERAPRETAVARDVDPAVITALAYPLATDPDLAGMNRASSALSLPSQDGSLPTLDVGAEFIAAARAEAVLLAGGAGAMRRAPDPAGEVAPLPAAARLTAAALAAGAPVAASRCAAQAEVSMIWAARLPAAFPVYPRGATQYAAGTDRAGCRLRAVRFVTPVPAGEVLDFYYTQALAAGYSATRVRQQGEDRLSGTRDQRGYSVWLQPRVGGRTGVDLVTW